MTWSNIQTPRPFVKVEGQAAVQDLLSAAFGILGGRSDNNTLDRLVKTDPQGRQLLINDDCWWLYTDFQCHYHALYGWRPFCGADMRRTDFSTWSIGFKHQVTPELQEHFRQKFNSPVLPPLGWLPGQYSGDPSHFMFDTLAMFCANTADDSVTWAFEDDKTYPGCHLFAHFGTHDLNCDYPLMNCISATDWMLWERDVQVAREYLPRIERFLEAIATRMDGGFFLFGPQGSQIEWGHAGWRRQSSTHMYCWKLLANVAEVHAMLGQADQAERYRQAMRDWTLKVRRFWAQPGHLVSGFTKDFSRTFGNGKVDGSKSDYLEIWPNVNAAVLGWMDLVEARALADRFETIPPLVENHLTLSNYPARPADEIDDDHDGFPPPGVHLNGGFHWMHGGSALGMYARGGQPNTLQRMEGMMEDHRDYLSVDYYNDWGRNKHSQWPKHPKGTHSVTCAGAFGHFFRGALDLAVTADTMRVAPASFPQIDELAMLEPVRWGAKEILLTVRGRGKIRQVHLDGKPVAPASEQEVHVPFAAIDAKASLEIVLA